MPDDELGADNNVDPDVTHADDGAGATSTPQAPRPTRRPRPAPASVYAARRRPQAAEGRSVSAIAVPVFAVVALVALVAAVLFSQFHHGSSNAAQNAVPTPAPTVPIPTPAPTATPVILPPPHTTKPGVAAVVNGLTVPMSLLVAEINANGIQMQQAHQDPNTGAQIPAVDIRSKAGQKQYQSAARATLDNLIQGALLEGYARAHHLEATKKDVDAQLANYEAQYGGATAFETSIKSQGFTMSMVNAIIAQSVTSQNVYNQIIKSAGCPCDVHARHILLKSSQSALAVKLAKELQADHGSNFAALAKKYSTDTGSAKQGGDLGFFSKGQMVAPFEKAAWSLKVGQISNPVKSQYGWHIIQVLGTRPSAASQQAYFNKWLAQQKARAAIHTYVQLPS
jgi:foldase protein PrsA